MRPHHGAVDHRIFVVGILGHNAKYRGPHTAFGPTAEAPMDVFPIAQVIRQVAPRDAGSVAIEHGIHEKSVVRRRCAHATHPPGQYVLDPVPLVIA